MLNKKVLESKEAQDIYLKIGRKIKSDIRLLNESIKGKEKKFYKTDNSSIEKKGSLTIVKQELKMDNSDKIIYILASIDDDYEYYDININIIKEGTDLVTGENYKRNIASINYFFIGDVVMITKIKDEEDLLREEEKRLSKIQKDIKKQKVK